MLKLQVSKFILILIVVLTLKQTFSDFINEDVMKVLMENKESRKC